MKNGGAEGGAGQSAIHHQFDRVDVRRIVRGKKKHSLGQIFRLAPTGTDPLRMMLPLSFMDRYPSPLNWDNPGDGPWSSERLLSAHCRRPAVRLKPSWSALSLG
jgi:hypothetical protein